MRILYLGKDYNSTYAASWYYLMQEICRKNDVIRYGPSRQYRSSFIPRIDTNILGPLGERIHLLYTKMRGLRDSRIETDVPTIVKRTLPDVILMDSFFPPAPGWKNLGRVNVPKAMVISDPHYRLTEKLKYASKNKIDLLLFDYLFVIESRQFRDWAESNPSVIYDWLPHSVNTEVFKDYGYARSCDVLSIGTMSPSVYPLRQIFFEKLRKDESLNFQMPRHAKHDIFKGASLDKTLVRENYARLIAKAKILLFDSSVYNYPLMKYFEGMACNTLVMAPSPKDSAFLKFIPGRNFVEVDASNFEERIMHYLHHEKARVRIARFGRETTEKYHSTTVRAEQLVSMLSKIQ